MRKPKYPFVTPEDTEASWAAIANLREQLDAAQQQIAALREEHAQLKAENDGLWEIHQIITNDARAEIARLTAERDEALDKPPTHSVE